MRHTRYFLSWSALVLLCLVASATVEARVVEVAWSPDAEDVELRTAAQARAAAFRRAVIAEALDILPGVPSEPRQELLREYLLPKAGDYVLSYSEAAPEAAAPVQGKASVAEDTDAPAAGVDLFAPGQPASEQPAVEQQTPTVRTLRMDVTVNRAGLKKTLQRMGVYYTINTRQAYDLSLLGEASGAWEDLGRLQMLSGVTVQRGAMPLVEFQTNWREPAEDAKKGEDQPVLEWTGRMDTGNEQWTASGKSIADVWFDLWGRFFSLPGAEAGVVDELHLAVRGWYAPDGVHAFNAELMGWEGVVEDAVMTTLVMLPDGIGAVWSVKTLSKAALTEKLDLNLPARGLSWEFASEIAPQ